MDSSASPSAPREGLGRLGVRIYRYRALVKRHWWVLVLTISLGVAYEGWVLYQQPRLFESVSQLNITEEVSYGIGVTRTQSAEQFVGTQLTLLKSPEVMERAKQRVSLEAPQLQPAVPSITTSVIPKTAIFQITGLGTDPEYTQRFVDAAATGFVEYRREQQDRHLHDISGGLTDQSGKVGKELEAAQARLQKFIEANNMPFWKETAQSSATYLSGLKNRQAALQTELRRLQQLTPDQLLVIPPAPAVPMAPAAAPAGENAAPAAGAAPVSFSSDLYSMYLQKTQELSSAQARLEERRRVWKPAHPKLQAIEEEVDQIERSLKLIKQQNAEAVAQNADAYKADLLSLDASIKVWEAKVLEASAKDVEYQRLQTNVTDLQAQLENVRKNVETIVTQPNIDMIQLLNRATPATEVPRGTLKHLAMGLIGGFVIGVLILALLDRADDRMTSSSEILEQFTEPILGQIPNVADSRNKSGLPLLLPDDERYTYAEAFRSLRSSLIFMPNQSELRTVLITSAIPNEGKSTIASNLGITMSAAGANVALVDADLRRGDLAALFDMDGRTGLSNVLRGEVSWQSAIRETRYPNLSLIPRGPVTNQSSELLLLPTLTALLDGLRDHYDFIVFNTAPILATDDTPSLSPNFDGTLMVMRAQFTSARLTQNALNALYQRQVNVLGLVLNCVDTEMPDYYYYRYPKYYAAQ